jgi:DNA (cytosine-5)-methyltransferase 1
VYKAKYWAKENNKKSWPKIKKRAPKIRLADFFCGCGGLTLGAFIACAKTGWNLEIKAAADAWEDALAVYKRNFSKNLAISSAHDLSEMVTAPGSIQLSNAGEAFAETMGELDIIVAGPPCQGHSDLNNSSRRDDPRNLLYTIPVAFALVSRAKIMILENVPTVVHSSDGVVNSALDSLESAGYSVVEFVADAQDFGLPQTRKRHLLVASTVHSKPQIVEILAKLNKRKGNIELWPFIQDLECEPEDERLITKRSKISKDNVERINYLFEKNAFDLPNTLRPPCHRDKSHSYVSMYGRLHKNRPAQTITSGFGSMGQGRFVHPTQPRMITAHEAARIQGFPDYFDFGGVEKITALREMIGNAVPPAIIAGLLSLLIPGLPIEEIGDEEFFLTAA